MEKRKRGRPKGTYKPDHLRRRHVSIRLPGWLIDWVNKTKPENMSQIIETSLKKYYNLGGEI